MPGGITASRPMVRRARPEALCPAVPAETPSRDVRSCCFGCIDRSLRSRGIPPCAAPARAASRISALDRELRSSLIRSEHGAVEDPSMAGRRVSLQPAARDVFEVIRLSVAHCFPPASLPCRTPPGPAQTDGKPTGLLGLCLSRLPFSLVCRSSCRVNFSDRSAKHAEGDEMRTLLEEHTSGAGRSTGRLMRDPTGGLRRSPFRREALASPGPTGPQTSK